MSQPVKEFWKSVNIWGSYGQEFGVLFFWDSVFATPLSFSATPPFPTFLLLSPLIAFRLFEFIFPFFHPLSYSPPTLHCRLLHISFAEALRCARVHLAGAVVERRNKRRIGDYGSFAAAISNEDRLTIAVASTQVQGWGDEPQNGVGCWRGTPLPTPAWRWANGGQPILVCYIRKYVKILGDIPVDVPPTKILGGCVSK